MTKHQRNILDMAKKFDANAFIVPKAGHSKLVVRGKKFTISGTPKDSNTAIKKVSRDLRRYLS
ncbi:hypothetical protein [Vibrio alginolyticus]|uniref:hypothetical protein n=1 Tax=Vibrio alginolyticus TaxID=663 RepID=UPI001BD38711|nr:hypothetical protein [Vibrio alginolyticus]MBS9935821.1 hypothetical protein [Vibrio alginolyticus]